MNKFGHFRWRPALIGLVTFIVGIFQVAADPGPNLMRGDFESGAATYNPWAGVDDSGNLRVFIGKQMAVDDSGVLNPDGVALSPSVAVGDLNGDGLPDLVVADARGFFWFYPNSGTATAPVFTHGEIMPIWLNAKSQLGDVVPRIQLIDFDGDGKLDLVAGTYNGGLYFIRNEGSLTAPRFRVPSDVQSLQIPTRSDKTLWCNFLSPFLYDWTGTGRLDLVAGEGTYSSNNIYLLSNKGSNDRPAFSEEAMSKIIPGMGREHLTPVVVDWNNDGKPDIITGEREGYLDVYLNQADNKADPPSFDPESPLHVIVGDSTKVGAFTTVAVADINGDKLFDLVTGKVDGHIAVALNHGTLGSPHFGALTPFKGTNPYPPILLPSLWEIDKASPFGAPNEILECVNAKIEPGFKPPTDFAGKGAMRFSVFQPQNKYFKESYFPSLEADPNAGYRSITYTGGLVLPMGNTYQVSFDLRSTGNVSDLTWVIYGIQVDKKGQHFPIILRGDSIQPSDDWNRISQRVEVDSKTDEPNVSQLFGLKFQWKGDGTVYFDDVSFRNARQ